MKITRRALSLGLFAPLAATASPVPPAKESPRESHRRKRFTEVAASLYTWDLAEEGVEPILETLRETAQVNSIYFMAMMHAEKRPLTDYYFPRTLQPKTYIGEDARVHWRPHPEFYRDSRIKPRLSDHEDLKKTDWLEALVAACRKSGFKTGAEISHTVLDAERASGEYVSMVQKDIWGNPLGQIACHNNPDVRVYTTALFCDLVANYDLDYIITAILPFAHTRPPMLAGVGGEQHKPGTLAFGFWGSLPAELREAMLKTTLGGCFCEHCQKAASAQGLDLKAVRRALLPLANMVDHPEYFDAHRLKVMLDSSTSPVALLLRHPELFDLLKFRCGTMAVVYKHLHDAMVKFKPNIDFRENAHLTGHLELAGFDYAALKPFLGSIRSSDYSEQSGQMERMEEKKRFLLSLRDAVGDDLPMYSAIAVRPKSTPELIRKAVQISADCGADGLSLAHYDSASLRHLEAVGDGLKEAGITVG